MPNSVKYIFMILFIIFLYIIAIQLNTLIKEYQDHPTNKDIVMVYELCKKKTGSQTNFILKSYGEEDTYFKQYLLNK